MVSRTAGEYNSRLPPVPASWYGEEIRGRLVLDDEGAVETGVLGKTLQQLDLLVAQLPPAGAQQLADTGRIGEDLPRGHLRRRQSVPVLRKLLRDLPLALQH